MLLVQSHTSAAWGLQCLCLQCWQLAPTRDDLTTPKSQVVAQHNCTLTLLYFFHTTTAASPFPGPWPAWGRTRKTLDMDAASFTKIQKKRTGEEHKEHQTENKGSATSQLLGNCTCTQAQKSPGGKTGWLGQEETIRLYHIAIRELFLKNVCMKASPGCFLLLVDILKKRQSSLWTIAGILQHFLNVLNRKSKTG